MPIERIRGNDWSLAAGRYKSVTTEAVNHDAPADILRDLLKVEKEIVERGEALLHSFASQKGQSKGEGQTPDAKL